MLSKFIMEGTVIFLRSLERQPFIVLFLLGALIASGWWNLEMRKDFRTDQQETKIELVDLRQSVVDCDSARTRLAIRVAVLETTLNTLLPPTSRRKR